MPTPGSAARVSAHCRATAGSYEAGPGQVERVADVGEIGKERLEPWRAVADGRQLETRGVGDVERQGDLAPRRAQHGHPSRARPHGEPGAERGHLDQLVERAHPDHARRAEGGIADLVAARHGAGMRHHRLASALGAPALHHDDGLAEDGRPSRGSHEALGMAELLEESDDDPHVVVVHQVVDVVGRGGGRLVARRDEVAQADVAAGIQERDADGAALHDGRHPALRDVVRHRRAPRGGAARKVEEAEAIRPAHRHAVRAGRWRRARPGRARHPRPLRRSRSRGRPRRPHP